MQYRVIADCIDLKQKFRKKGEIVSVPDGEPVSKWFKSIESKSETKVESAPDPDYVEDDILYRKNKQELYDIAAKEHVDIPVGATNPEITRLIRANRKKERDIKSKKQ